MLPVHGFYGHIKHNDLLSVVMFAGFLLALQLLAAVVLFLPVLVYDIDHALFVNSAGYAWRYASLVCAVGAAVFLAQFFFHVHTVRADVYFDYVDRYSHPRLCNIVETLAIGAGLPFPRVGLIDSDARNAFACGISEASAVVVATRGLVDALDDDELSAVIAHEIAHIRNGDIRLMAAANVMMRDLLFLQRNNVLRIVDYRQIILFVILPPFLLLFLVGGLVSGLAVLLARVSRLLISSSREFIADAEAVRMTHNPSALISALRRIDGRSVVEGVGPDADAMMIDGAAAGALATHPTISERIDVLTRLSGAMAYTWDAGAQRQGARPTFGLRNTHAPVAVPERGVFSRISVDIDSSAFGIAPAVGGLVIAGIAALAFLYPNDFKSLSGIAARFSPAAILTFNGTIPEGINSTFHITSDIRPNAAPIPIRDKPPHISLRLIALRQ
jgi:Zn-dependent protease with chaperone function